MLQHTDTCHIPEWAVCYIAYGDESRMTELDTIRADNWLKRYNKPVFEFGEEKFFVHNPAFGISADCLEVKIFEDVEE